MRVFAALFALCTLAACGFSPMYAPGPSGEGPIGAVEIRQINGRAGHVLRTELTRLLAVDASGPSRQLNIDLLEQVVGLALRLDESASRAELRLRANYVLLPADGQGQPLRGTVTSIVNYEVPLADFAATSAQDDARERAAEQLAQRLRAELALRIAQERRGAHS